MTRRGFFLIGIACALRADDADQVWSLFTDMAGALADGKAEEFLNAFNRAMPGYEEIQKDVSGLLAAYDVHSSIELLNETGDATARTVELDWFLQIVEKQDTYGVTRRRESVRCQLVKNKKWRLTGFQPLSFFAPPTR